MISFALVAFVVALVVGAFRSEGVGLIWGEPAARKTGERAPGIREIAGFGAIAATISHARVRQLSQRADLPLRRAENTVRSAVLVE